MAKEKTFISLFSVAIAFVISLLCFTPHNAFAAQTLESDTGVYLKQIENPFEVTDTSFKSHSINLGQGDSYLLVGSITYSDAYQSDVTYTWDVSKDGGITWTTLNCAAKDLQITDTVPGEYTYRLTAKDTIGNSATETWNVFVAAKDTTPAQPSDNQVSSNGSNVGTNQTSGSVQTGDTAWYIVWFLIGIGGAMALVVFCMYVHRHSNSEKAGDNNDTFGE